jgi:hypothetical protein
MTSPRFLIRELRSTAIAAASWRQLGEDLADLRLDLGRREQHHEEEARLGPLEVAGKFAPAS